MSRAMRFFRDLFLLIFFSFAGSASVIAGVLQARAPAPIQTGLPRNEKSVPAIVQEAGKSIVMVLSSNCAGGNSFQGSGFVISPNGAVATNFHVIDGCSSAVVKFTNGAFYQIEGVLATDPTKDIALLKIDTSDGNFPFLPMAGSSNIQVGDHVVAIGSPLALLKLTGDTEVSTESTVSDGIISGKREWAGHAITVLQTTAPISHGSSGGALLDMQGRVIGITTMTFSDGQNLNFAVPAEYIEALTKSESLKPLGATAPVEKAAATNPRSSLEQFAGTYMGTWQSHYGTGVAVLTVTENDGILSARIAITGSPAGYTGDSLAVAVEDIGDGFLKVTLTALNSPLVASGIFRNRGFIGDYRFKFHHGVDVGHWALSK
jgi:serine protease Do